MANLIHQYAASNFRGDNPTPRGVSDNRDLVINFTVNEDGAANLGASDVWRLAYLKGGTSVELVGFKIDGELDTHATPTLTIDVGYNYTNTALTDDDNYFVAASTIGQNASGGYAAIANGAKLLEGDAYLEVTFAAAAATAATGEVTGTAIFRVGPGDSQ